MNAHFIPDLGAQLPAIPPDSIVSRRVYKDERLDVTLFGFAAGQELSEHTAARPAILHVLAGQARLTLGDATHAVGPGAWTLMPAHLPHAITAETAVTLLLILLRE